MSSLANIFAGASFRTDGGTVKVGAGSNNYYSQISTAYNYPYVDSYFDSVAGASYEGRLNFRTSTAGGSLANRMIIYHNGQIGVGTNSVNAYAKFEVSGNIMSSGSSTILMLNNTGGTPQSWWIGQDISGSNDGIFYIYNQTTSTQAINIRKNNNVLIGTSTDNGFSLQVNGSIWGQKFRMNDTGGGYVTWEMENTTRWRMNYLARLSGYGAGALTTDASGNVTASSDRTLKKCY